MSIHVRPSIYSINTALTEKMHCREQFLQTASEYSAIVW